MPHLAVGSLERSLSFPKKANLWFVGPHCTFPVSYCAISRVFYPLQTCNNILWAIAFYEIPYSKLHAAHFVLFARKQVGKHLYLLTAAISAGFLINFYRQDITLVFGSSVLRSFSNHSVDAGLHVHQGYIIPFWHTSQPLRCTNKSHKFTQCVTVGTPKHDSIFWPLWHVPVFTPLKALFFYSRTTYPLRVIAMFKEQQSRLDHACPHDVCTKSSV